MKYRLLSIFIFLLYYVLIVELLLFKKVRLKIGHLMINFSGGIAGPPNFIPLKTITSYLVGDKGSIIVFFELIGNIFLFVPIGFIVPFLFSKWDWKKSVILGILASLIIEILQLLLQVGIFDIDDIILNSLGVVIGYLARGFILKLGAFDSRKKMR